MCCALVVLVLDNVRREPAQAITQLGKSQLRYYFLEVTLSLVAVRR